MTLALNPTHLNILTVLTRLAQRRPEETCRLESAFVVGDLDTLLPVAIAVAVETGDPIGRVLANRVRATPDVTRAERIHDLLPYQTVALMEVAEVVAGEVAEALRRRAADAGDDHTEDAPVVPRLAASLDKLAIALSDVGRREEALAAGEEAVELLGPFFKAAPQVFGERMRTVGNNYLRYCADLHRAPRGDLVLLLEAVLGKTRAEGPGLFTNKLTALVNFLKRFWNSG